MIKPRRIPDAVRAATWYANHDKIDWQKCKEQLITTILDRGSLQAVRWAFRFYGPGVIRKVVAHPKRGQWLVKSLNFWSKFFNLKIAPKTYQKALFRLHPDYPVGVAPFKKVKRK